MVMRHCDSDCGILNYVKDGDECPILEHKQKRKEGDWWIEKDGEKIFPLCEDKVVRVAKKKRKLLI
jgi:uncharacterized Zn finger protein (UPF0148 family)